MPISEARVAITSADRYAGQLSKHFAHKIPVTDDDAGGARIAFPFGAALVRAEAGLLLLRAEADDEAALEHVRNVISTHLARFAFRETRDIVWQPQTALPPNPDADALVILLHGVGSSGQNMMTLESAWRPLLPRARFVAPDAPFAFNHGAGRQWFSITGVTEQNRSQRIAAARPDFDRVVRHEMEEHGFADRPGQVVLVGFSQGSMMLLDAVASGRFPVAACVAFAGRLATELPFAAAQGTKLLLVHGSADTVVPSLELDRARTALQAAGYSVKGRVFPGVGHTIAPEAANHAAEFVRASLAQQPGAQSWRSPPHGQDGPRDLRVSDKHSSAEKCGV
jgi:phospholipase/carboxylesterase